MDIIDTLFRGAASALFALLAVKFALASPRTVRTLAAAALNLAMIAYVLESSPHFALDCGPMSNAVSFIPVLNPALLWLVGVAYFDDEFRPRIWHALLVISLLAPLVAPELGLARFAFVIGLCLHLAWIAYRTKAEDLVASRIAARKLFFAAVAIVGLTITVVEIKFSGGAAPDALLLVQAIALTALTATFARISLTLDADWTVPKTAKTPPASTTPSLADAPLMASLAAAMQDSVWRT
jgi:hypothetical protein